MDGREGVAEAKQLVEKLKPWWAVVMLVAFVSAVAGGILAINRTGALKPAKKAVGSEKGDDSWIDRAPDHVARAESVSSPTPLASVSAAPTPQAQPTPVLPLYQQPVQSYATSPILTQAAQQREQLYRKALASDLIVGGTGHSQVLETPRLLSADGKPIEGQGAGAGQNSGPIIADPRPASPYSITAGTVIYGTLETGINSDLPGDVLGRVSQDVKDSSTLRYVLIPQGSKLLGSYSNQLIPSQERLLVKWRKIVFPNGGELELPELTGADSAGFSGFHDEVNHHYVKVWAPALLMSAMSAGMMMSEYPMMMGGPYGGYGFYMNPGMLAGMGAGQGLSQQAMTHMSTVQISPTIKIRPGYHFRVLVTRELVFSGPYRGQSYAEANQ